MGCDLVVLAARLALAQEAAKHPLLLLDEPFLTMDAEREARAIRMVEAFRRRTDWQVIVLTKEARLAERMSAISGGGRIDLADVWRRSGHVDTPAAAPPPRGS